MKPFEKCPVCGGELENHLVEKQLGQTKVSMTVNADVCRQCGELLYTEESIKSFEAVRCGREKPPVTPFNGSVLFIDER